MILNPKAYERELIQKWTGPIEVLPAGVASGVLKIEVDVLGIQPTMSLIPDDKRLKGTRACKARWDRINATEAAVARYMEFVRGERSKCP